MVTDHRSATLSRHNCIILRFATDFCNNENTPLVFTGVNRGGVFYECRAVSQIALTLA